MQLLICYEYTMQLEVSIITMDQEIFFSKKNVNKLGCKTILTKDPDKI